MNVLFKEDPLFIEIHLFFRKISRTICNSTINEASFLNQYSQYTTTDLCYIRNSIVIPQDNENLSTRMNTNWYQSKQ